jgi:hypothetical protein
LTNIRYFWRPTSEIRNPATVKSAAFLRKKKLALFILATDKLQGQLKNKERVKLLNSTALHVTTKAFQLSHFRANLI